MILPIKAALFGAISVALLLSAAPLSAQTSQHDRARHVVHTTAPKSARTKISRPKKHTGMASVYADKLRGKTTASGKPLDGEKLTAASRTLPLNSEAKVTNLKTGRSTTVTITDRGPYAKNRVIDLSPAAAREVGITPKAGVAPVDVQPTASPPAKRAPAPNAEKLAEKPAH